MKPAENMERRGKARLSFLSPISLKDFHSGDKFAECLLNYSDTGFYFEGDQLLQPGTEVFIGLRRSPYEANPSDYTCYRTLLMWRKELKEGSHFFYGYGCQIKQRKSPEGSEPSREHRRHPRRSFNKPLHFEIEDRISEGFASDISPARVLVKSDRQPRTGQVVTLGIPDNSGKGLILKGKVVWSNADGFGLKFITK
jgi:hypothetical protein